MEINFLSIIIVFVLTSLTYLIFSSMTRKKNFPPGPMRLPFFGSIDLLLEDNIVFSLGRLAKKYGNVIGFNALGVNIVYIHGYEAHKEMLFTKAKEFCNRPEGFNTLRGWESYGISNNSFGPSWEANRKLFHVAVRNHGGDRGAEEIVTREASYMIRELEKLSETRKANNPEKIFEYVTFNVVASLVFGHRYEYDDDKVKIASQVSTFSECFKDPLLFLLVVFPALLKFWVPQCVKTMMASTEKIYDFCVEEVEAHVKTLNPNCPRDYIDHYIIKLDKEEIPSGCKPVYSEVELIHTLVDLCIAGIDTTKTTLVWATLYMAAHQDMQEKVHLEIDQVLGLEKEVKYEDRLDMPYTFATIHEVLRFSSITAEGLIHCPMQDTELCGYTIPKGTMVCPDLYSCHFQTDKWKDPTRFNPDNFLSENGKFQPNDALMVFGGGRRICVGMSFAKQAVFLLFVSMLQKFNILPEKDGMELSFKPIQAFLLEPQHYNYRFVQRI